MIPTPENELLDVIDEQENIIGPKGRSEIHQEGLLHKEIHVWFFDKNRNIIFQKRGVQKSSGGLFDATVGGHVDHGEEYLDTATRETKEETGLIITSSDLFLLRKFKETSHDKNGGVNNFLRAIYIFEHPILETDIKKEEGVIGVDFQKFSVTHLSNLSQEDSEKFDTYILSEEIPYIKKYLETHTL